MALNLLTAVFYLLPISGPGKGILLLLGLAAFPTFIGLAFVALGLLNKPKS